MANLSRNAKPSSAWTDHELRAFNIRVANADTETMFNTTQLPNPSPSVSDTILNNVERPEGQLPKDDRLFFRYLSMVERPESPESHVTDFTAHLLGMLDYDDGDRIICRRPELPFVMSGEHVDAQSDICVKDKNDIVLLVNEHKRTGPLKNPEPQLIAMAIAVFYQINLRRRYSRENPLESKYIPAITMFGSAPVFYRIPVTTTLLTALITGCYPAEETVVLRYLPPIPNRKTSRDLGMLPIANRRVVLQCFDAFKALL